MREVVGPAHPFHYCSPCGEASTLVLRDQGRACVISAVARRLQRHDLRTQPAGLCSGDDRGRKRGACIAVVAPLMVVPLLDAQRPRGYGRAEGGVKSARWCGDQVCAGGWRPSSSTFDDGTALDEDGRGDRSVRVVAALLWVEERKRVPRDYKTVPGLDGVLRARWKCLFCLRANLASSSLLRSSYYYYSYVRPHY